MRTPKHDEVDAGGAGPKCRDDVVGGGSRNQTTASPTPASPACQGPDATAQARGPILGRRRDNVIACCCGRPVPRQSRQLRYGAFGPAPGGDTAVLTAPLKYINSYLQPLKWGSNPRSKSLGDIDLEEA
jgi:hypothetical protein